MRRFNYVLPALIALTVISTSVAQTKATLTVTATVLPTKKQRAVGSSMVVQDGKGTARTLSAEQKARFAERPHELFQELKSLHNLQADESGNIRINIDY